MKFCIFGAGGVGSFLASVLHKAGQEVSVLARGAHLAAIKERGLRVDYGDATHTFAPACSDEPAALGAQDVVVVTTKATALSEVAKSIAPLLGPDTVTVFVTNGVPWWYFYGHGGKFDGRRIEQLDPDNLAWDLIGPERAIGGVINAPCTVVEPGVVSVEKKSSARHKLILGEPASETSSRLQTLVNVFGGTEFLEATASRNIRHDIWAKLVLNLSSGPLGAITEARLKDLFASAPCVAARLRIHHEAAAIAEAMGFPINVDIQAALESAKRSEHRVSMGQDMLLRRPLELDAMCLVPLQMARLMDVDTPTMDLVVELARLRAIQEGLYAAA